MIYQTAFGAGLSAADLLTVLNGSLSGTLVLSAVRDATVRDEADRIVDFRLALVNSQAESYLHLTGATGRTWKEVMGACWSPYLPSVFERVLRTQKPRQVEQAIDLPGRSSTRWFRFLVSPLGDGVTVSFDPTPGYGMNPVDPSHTDSRLRAVLDTTQTGLFIVSPEYAMGPCGEMTDRIVDFFFTDCNQAFADLAGLTPRDLRGQRASDAFPTYRSNGFAERIIDVYQRSAAERFEFYYAGDGLDRWFDISVKRFGNELLVDYLDIHELKRSEEQARRHQVLLSSILEGSVASLLTLEAIRDEQGMVTDLRVLHANSVVARLAGSTPEAMQGQPWDAYFPGIHECGLFDAYVRVFETGKPFQAEVYYPHDQVAGWFYISAKRFDDRGVTLSFIDISSLKEAERAHREQAQVLEGIFSVAPLSLVVHESVYDEAGNLTDLRFQRVNEMAARQLGRPVSELVGRTFSESFPGLMASNPFTAIFQAKRTGEMLENEIDHQGDGFEGTLLQKARWEGERFIYASIDISERKKAEEQLRQQQLLLRTVIDHSPAGLILVDPIYDESGRIVEFIYRMTNKTNADIVGKAIQEMEGHRIGDVFPGWQQLELFTDLVEVCRTGQSKQYIGEYDSFGIRAWFDYHYTKVGEGVLLTFLDVTALKEAEMTQQVQTQALERSNRDLLRSNDNLKQFAYIASHDLQEPLRKILSFGDILSERHGSQLGESGLDLIQRMQTASRRMSSLIHDLLAFSRISNHAPRLHQVDLEAIARGVLHDLELRLAESGGQVELGHLPRLSGDRSQLHQLMTNLITNALKFHRPGVAPRVVIRAQTVTGEALPEGTGLPAEARYHRIEVSDNGIGFDEKYLDRIFTLFQRLHGKTSYAGTGIGLAICKRVVENHHGYLTASSRPGKGSSFWIYLPA